MKTKQRIALAISILCLFAWGGSFAEPPVLTLESFSLRNGYAFGMTMEDAMKLADEEGLEVGESPYKQTLIYRNVPVGDYIAEKFLLGFDSRFAEISGLCEMDYRFESFPLSESKDHIGIFESLKAGLIQKYGEPSEEPDFGGAAYWDFPDFSIALGSRADLKLDCKYYYVGYYVPFDFSMLESTPEPTLEPTPTPTEEPLPTATQSLIGL